jgi:uncharacterized protein
MSQPWYRHRWPWLLMSGPAAVLLAGAVTTWIAFATADGLVAEDYYKQGVGLNRLIAREERAAQLGLSLELELRQNRIVVRLHGAAPEALFVHLAHATRAGHDQRLRLVPTQPGFYQAELPELPAGRWHIVVEDPRATWRIVKESS